MWGRQQSSEQQFPIRATLIQISKRLCVCVGTEAEAKHNARTFRYSSAGFVTPIEYTLLYAMLAVPTVYPESVMLEHIHEQDFSEFLLVKIKTPPTTASRTNSSIDEPYEEEEAHSYAQLSALMNMAAEMWPPPKEEQQSSPPNSNATNANNLKLCLFCRSPDEKCMLVSDPDVCLNWSNSVRMPSHNL